MFVHASEENFSTLLGILIHMPGRLFKLKTTEMD